MISPDGVGVGIGRWMSRRPLNTNKRLHLAAGARIKRYYLRLRYALPVFSTGVADIALGNRIPYLNNAFYLYLRRLPSRPGL